MADDTDERVQFMLTSMSHLCMNLFFSLVYSACLLWRIWLIHLIMVRRLVCLVRFMCVACQIWQREAIWKAIMSASIQCAGVFSPPMTLPWQGLFLRSGRQLKMAFIQARINHSQPIFLAASRQIPMDAISSQLYIPCRRQFQMMGQLVSFCAQLGAIHSVLRICISLLQLMALALW